MKKREIYVFKDYFKEFYKTLNKRIQNKIIWTFKIIEELDKIPEKYLKHIENTDGIYEIRVQFGNNIYRIFCFFDKNKIIVVRYGFQKKSQKTPKIEIEKAINIKKEYFNEK